MPQLIINGITFNYPSDGSEAGTWGQDASDWATEVSALLNTLAPTGTISTTESPIANNTTGSVAGLSFQSANTQAAIIFYKLKRSTLYEMGMLNIIYDNGVWRMSQEIGASSSPLPGVSFNIDDTSGQVTYTSSNSGTTGSVKFKSVATLT